MGQETRMAVYPPHSIYNKLKTVKEHELLYLRGHPSPHGAGGEKSNQTTAARTQRSASTPFAAQCMTRERLRAILSFFHFNMKPSYPKTSPTTNLSTRPPEGRQALMAIKECNLASQVKAARPQ
ncbi:hypothetical protein RRG08_051164 [Elysia crispata]|uniref:Uncharacterized protein n=1 Tax=Elysia crispata TaxID=231223 RepID=A0AAE1D1H9_9GAST|nr:hypothetical protein RRG08_051164 [Elysia crispata]